MERQPRTGRRGSDDGRPEREKMKSLIDCKEYYKDLYIDCLKYDAFSKSIFESTEKARHEMFCETLLFIYGAEFDKISQVWSQEALNEFYKN